MHDDPTLEELRARADELRAQAGTLRARADVLDALVLAVDRLAVLEARLKRQTRSRRRADEWKPTVLMGRLMAEVEQATEPLTATALGTLVHGKPRLVREAVDRLIAEGYLAVSPSRSKTLSVLRRYPESPEQQAPPWRQEPPSPEPRRIEPTS